MDQFEKQQKIYKVAEDDLAYRTWKGLYLQYRSAFAEYANAQPQEIRDLLWGYAESGRLMNQRLLNLACEDMEFPEDKPNTAE